jgi:hypothetical protein
MTRAGLVVLALLTVRFLTLYAADSVLNKPANKSINQSINKRMVPEQDVIGDSFIAYKAMAVALFRSCWCSNDKSCFCELM